MAFIASIANNASIVKESSVQIRWDLLWELWWAMHIDQRST